MAANSETGHAVNISNFKLMIDKCTAFGTKYNPSNEDLLIVNMTVVWKTGDEAHQLLTTAIQNSKNPINERQIIFDPLNKLVTKSVNYFYSTKASRQVKKDAKGLADKIRGFGVKVAKLPDGKPDPNHVSNSHQGFVQKADAFKQLVDLYKSDANYAPNEAELTTTILAKLATAMKTVNDNIGTIIAPVDGARITRDHALYDEDTGMVDISLACKDYVQGLFGAAKPEARMITGLKFTRPKRKK